MSNDKYYSKATWDSGEVSYNDEDIITLDQETAYIVAKVNGNSIAGLYGRVTAPEPTTATLSLLALAGLAARRRRH